MVTIAAGMTLGAYTILHDNAHLPEFAPPLQPIQPQHTVTVTVTPPGSNYGKTPTTTAPGQAPGMLCPTTSPKPDGTCSLQDWGINPNAPQHQLVPTTTPTVPTVPNIPGQPQYQVV